MKKTLVVCLVIFMLVTMCMSVLAAPGSFEDSPSGKPAPELVEGSNKDADCEAVIVVTSYSNRDQLSAESRLAIENAYASIVGAKVVTSLNGDIAGIAQKKGVSAEGLAVSDLFNIGEENCATHVDHGYFKIVLDSETMNNFVCLLKFDEGEWTIVKNAKLTADEGYLEFTEEDLGAYAIVVSTTDIPEAPNEGGFPWWILLIIAALIVVSIVIYKKKMDAIKNEQIAE